MQEPLLLFLSLWHCLGVHIYWDFSLRQAMTEPHKTGQREAEREKKGEIKDGRSKRQKEKKEHIIRSHAQSTKNFNNREQNGFKRSLKHNLKSKHEEKEIVKSFTGLRKFEVKHRSAQQGDQHSRHAGRYCPKGYKFVY